MASFLRNCNCKVQPYDGEATKEVEKQKYLQSNFTPIIIFTCSAPPPMALITALSVLWFFYIHVVQNEFNGWYGRKIEMQMQFSTVKHHEWGSPKTIEEVDFSHLDTREGNAWFSPLKLLRMFTWGWHERGKESWWCGGGETCDRRYWPTKAVLYISWILREFCLFVFSTIIINHFTRI